MGDMSCGMGSWARNCRQRRSARVDRVARARARTLRLTYLPRTSGTCSRDRASLNVRRSCSDPAYGFASLWTPPELFLRCSIALPLRGCDYDYILAVIGEKNPHYWSYHFEKRMYVFDFVVKSVSIRDPVVGENLIIFGAAISKIINATENLKLLCRAWIHIFNTLDRGEKREG